jgi:hypothetical protein
MVFKDVEIDWKGETYKCPANQVFNLIKHLETSGINIFDVIQHGHVTTKSEALSSCLEFMGCDPAPTCEECYSAMFTDGDSVTAVMAGLQMMIVPPNVVEQALSMTEEEAEVEAEKAKKKG